MSKRRLSLSLLAGVLIGMALSPFVLKAVQYSPIRITDNQGNYVGSNANPLFVTVVPSPGPTPGLMPTFVSAGAHVYNAFASNNVVLSAPAGIVTNDLMVAQITYYNVSNLGTGITGSPGTWNLIRCDKSGSSLANTCLLWHLATGSGDGPWTFTETGSSNDYINGNTAAFRGANLTTPIDANVGSTVAGSTTITSVSLTPTVSNSLLVPFFAVNIGTGAGTLDTALFTVYNSSDAVWVQMAGSINAPNVGVASNTYTSTLNSPYASGTTETINIRP